MSHSRASSISSTYSSDIEISSDYDSEEDSSNDLDVSNYFFLSSSLLEKLKLVLNEDEKDLTDEFCQKMEEISEQDNQAYNQNEDYTENALRNVDRLVSEYLKKGKGIRLNLYYDNKNSATIADLIFLTIEGIAGNAMNNVKGGYSESKGYRYGGDNYIDEEAIYLGDRILEGNCINTIESIAINVLLKGGKTILKAPFQYSGLEHIEFESEINLLKKCKKIESKLKNIAYKSIVSKSERRDGFKVAIDNGYFYIEYEESSVVELSRITNSQTIEDLNLKVSILKIGESIIRVEKVGEKRNYTNIPKGRIKMSFTTEVGKISIYLCSDENNSSRIKVEIDEENQKKFSRLKDKSSLGKNCLLGKKNVVEAIQDKEFTKNESYKLKALSTFMEQASISNILSSLRNIFSKSKN